MQTHHLTVNARNEVYFGEAPKHQASMVDAKGGLHLVLKDALNWPKVPRFSTDQSLFVINDPNTRWVWSFQVQPDGSLINGQPFYHLETPDESSKTEASGMAFDTEGYLYVATNLGVQVCDQAGRVNAILNPRRGAVRSTTCSSPTESAVVVCDRHRKDVPPSDQGAGERNRGIPPCRRSRDYDSVATGTH